MNDLTLPASKRELIEVKQELFDRLDSYVTKVEFENHSRMVENRFDTMDRKIDERFEEAKRFMGVLHEDMRHNFQLALEILAPLAPRMTDHEQRLQNLEEQVSIVKAAIRIR